MPKPTYQEICARREALRADPRYAAARQAAIDEELRRIRGYLDRQGLRAVCPHPPEFNEYWHDPSGNNGGGNECLLCGADR